MVKKEKTVFSFKIRKDDFELRAMIKRLEQKKLSVSEVAKSGLKFYFKHMLSDKADPRYERLLLEEEKKIAKREFDEKFERLRKVNNRITELDNGK